MAPSTLSRTVTQLEAILGITLLRRSAGAIELTPEGAAAVGGGAGDPALDRGALGHRPRQPHPARAAESERASALRAASSRRAYEASQARFPQVSETLDMIDRPVDLIDNHADLAIRFDLLKDSDVLHRRLGRTAWKLCTEPAYLERASWPARPADFAALSRVGFPAPVQAENGEAVRALVMGGMGVVRFSDYMVADDVAARLLVELFPGQLDTAPFDITALDLTRASGPRRLAVFPDCLRELLPGRA